MLVSVVALPFVFATLSLGLKNRRITRFLLPIGSILHALAVTSFWFYPQEDQTLLTLDSLGLLFLSILTALFLPVSIYTVGYLKEHGERSSLTVGCLFFFLSSTSLTCVSGDLGLLWVAVEATTLASAPLIYFHKNHKSLEATWKYLLICSVGIALALMGNIFLSIAMESNVKGDENWLKVAFILLTVGYGTKMGLAPLHTWLPDAHSEAPSMVSALLSGALLNCAFLGILRAYSIVLNAGLGEWGGKILILFGLLSISLAALFLFRQGDFKRMLAYSSVEHMGILALGMGVGGLAGMGAFLHMVNHSMVKGLLFLTAGNLLLFYQTKQVPSVKGVLRAFPKTGFLWVAGILALSGFPPFGLFWSEWFILKGLVDKGMWIALSIYGIALLIVFFSLISTTISMCFGNPSSEARSFKGEQEPLWMWGPPLLLLSLSLLWGIFMPEPLMGLLATALKELGGV